MIKSIKRAFTSDGGGFLKVRDENGKIDIHTVGATLIRIGLVIGILYVAKITGLDPGQIFGLL